MSQGWIIIRMPDGTLAKVPAGSAPEPPPPPPPPVDDCDCGPKFEQIEKWISELEDRIDNIQPGEIDLTELENRIIALEEAIESIEIQPGGDCNCQEKLDELHTRINILEDLVAQETQARLQAIAELEFSIEQVGQRLDDEIQDRIEVIGDLEDAIDQVSQRVDVEVQNRETAIHDLQQQIDDIKDSGVGGGEGGNCKCDGKLGLPSDETWDDGLFEWVPEMKSVDAMDDINEVLAELAPENAKSLQGAHLTLSVPLNSGKLVQGLDSKWYGPCLLRYG